MRRLIATDLMPDFAGRTLDRGRYRVLNNLGSGTYGKVYRVFDTAGSPKRGIFAIKCLNKSPRGSRADLLQEREFAHHKLVSGHPNIVTFHRCFSDGLYKYVVLDFCEGGDLFSAITEKRLFYGNGDLVKRAFVQLINAVEHCHALGVFHRDIKPENVLCSDDGTDIRLADFGLSIKSPASNDFGCGSLYYMSPECIGQIYCQYYSTRFNDIWALGVILTNMITGRNPWRYAIFNDDCFAAYLYDNDFLKRVLPISEGVNTILKDIFILNPSHRISLSELRKKVLSLEAFSVPESEEDNAIYQEVGVLQKTPPQEGSASPLDSDEQSIVFELDTERPSVQASSASQDVIVESRRSAKAPTASLTVPSSASSGSSGPESKGPITPATHAIDVGPPVDIPDISREVLGYAAETTIVSKPQTSVTALPVKPRRPADIFRSALQRIKILSRKGHQV